MKSWLVLLSAYATAIFYVLILQKNMRLVEFNLCKKLWLAMFN